MTQFSICPSLADEVDENSVDDLMIATPNWQSLISAESYGEVFEHDFDPPIFDPADEEFLADHLS